MKKILLAVFTVITCGTAFAANKTNYATDWGVFGTKGSYTNIYNTFVDTLFASNVHIIAARAIYKNGAEFCLIKTVGQQEKTSSYSPAYNNSLNMSYYIEKKPTCTTICKPGYFGAQCEAPVVKKTPCANTNYENFFKSGLEEFMKANISSLDRTFNIDVFDEGTITIRGDNWNPDYNYPYAIMLGIVDFVDNGVMVAPYMITGNKSVKTKSEKILLCAQGFNEVGGKCVRPANCKSIVPHLGGGNSPDNNNSTNDDDTASCGSGKDYERYGPDSNGNCLDCSENKQIYSKSDKKCVKVKQYNKKQMREGTSSNNKQCWLKTDPTDFANCVTGNLTVTGSDTGGSMSGSR